MTDILKYPEVSAKVVDYILSNPSCLYSAIHSRLGRDLHWKLGRALHQLIEMGVVTRSETGRYSLSESSAKVLAA
jgi:DNA-binding IclR family transcriptional regulator